ncbi:MAG: hypothetical protein HN704_05590 [Bacteroidetes bacterium]|jgi:predicted nucleic acid-binding protein|nr:hypothetical protein [Bacteroidota bacterium]MBT7145209.1 hypothetical protein [Bacteroidota bacterium]MBT7491066.1 hypothetical protein [Bacteroidota bacterium]
MNREILTAALFQHSSKVQSYKKDALDSIVERILFFTTKNHLSTHEIQISFVEITGYTIPQNHFEESLGRLIKSDCVLQNSDEDLFSILPKRKNEIEISEKAILQKQSLLIDKLFKHSPEKKSSYIEPFWFTVSNIFSTLGDYSAKIVAGKIDKEQILYPVLNRSIEECKKNFEINYDFFRQKVIEFFSELNDPNYNETKCVLAQNYFIAKSIGINPNSENFSKDIFKNQIIYLDTNVLLAIISKHNRKHNNAIASLKALKKLDIQICITKETIIEYETWVQKEFERIRKTTNQIPKKTKSKVESPVYQDYYHIFLEKSEKEEASDFDDILTDLEQYYFNFREVLKQYISEDKIKYIDNAWFETVEKEPNYESTVKLIKEKYREVSVREKGDGAAVHDAKVLLWIDKASRETGIKHLFLTTDTSMPLIQLGDIGNSNNIILEAILQWLIPLTNGHKDEDVDKTISEFLKQRIVPKEFIFEIKDFLIFDQLHMECQELPAEDVENCIIYLKKNAAGLNPNKAADREKFASEIAKYFIDPGKKFKLELSVKEKENQQLQAQLGDVYQLLEKVQGQNEEKDKQLSELKTEHDENLKGLKENHDQEISSIKDSLTDVNKELTTIREEQERKIGEKDYSKWKRPAKIAFVFFIVILLFGILQLLPNWKYNYPAKLVEYINGVKEISEAKFRLWMTFDGFLTTGLIISLFVFSYKRLFNKENKRNMRKELKLKTTKR